MLECRAVWIPVTSCLGVSGTLSLVSNVPLNSRFFAPFQVRYVSAWPTFTTVNIDRASAGLFATNLPLFYEMVGQIASPLPAINYQGAITDFNPVLSISTVVAYIDNGTLAATTINAAIALGQIWVIAYVPVLNYTVV